MLGIGFWELLIILLVGLLVFGPKKLPEIGRAIGKAMYQLKNASSSFTQEMSKEWHKLEAEDEEEGKGKGKGEEEAKDGDAGD